MKEMKKRLITASAVCIGAGVIISFGALAAVGFDLSKLNTVEIVTNTYSVENSFKKISIEEPLYDVVFVPSQDGNSRVVCAAEDNISYTVEVENDTLVIECEDNSKWYDHIGIYTGEMGMTIYLSEKEYDFLSVKGKSSDIEIPADFCFADIEIKNTSGGVDLQAAVKNDLNITVSSGDINLEGIECKNITVNCTSGEVDLLDVIASENIAIESSSGDVTLRGSDADSLQIRTTSGEVSGTLLTDKVFIVDTGSGEIDIPESAEGGKCEVKTSSGDINMSVRPNQ
ncbi:MAG: DUF4097 family beta strand repeat-containing protein [Eubacteriales bacterium]|nr:DUF4097 family beta strand repeat-containing protein [Eubacteriales bacterium]